MISHSLHNHPRNECLSCVITKERSLAGLICRSIIYIFLWSSLQKTEAIFCFLWCILVWGKIFGNLTPDFFLSYSLWISFILLNFSLQVSFSKTYVSSPNHECIVFYQQSFHRNIYNLCIYIYINIYIYIFFFFPEGVKTQQRQGCLLGSSF